MTNNEMTAMWILVSALPASMRPRNLNTWQRVCVANGRITMVRFEDTVHSGFCVVDCQ